MNIDQKTIDQLSINAIRFLSVDAINKAKSGHPGTPLGAAPIAYTLYAKHLNVCPSHPKFFNRDRFVLSAGHASMLLYSTLHLAGFDISIDDIKNFRQFGSKTSGHPEYGVDGVETTTGPLGQGIANAVGMAIAETKLEEKFNKPDATIVDHYTYALSGDGCMMEGIEYEAASLAGSLKLGKLIVFYDKNDITIEGNINCAFTEDVGKRHAAQGWQVLYVDDVNDIAKLDKAIKKAKAEKTKPSLIICNSTIGYGSPLAGTPDCHGSPLGAENTAKTREALGYNYPEFTVPEEVYQNFAKIRRKYNRNYNKWKKLFKEYKVKYPELAKEYEYWMSGKVCDLSNEPSIREFEKVDASRGYSSTVLNKLPKFVPNIFGGSADLGPSNKTTLKGLPFYSADNRGGSNIHFGIREHAMGAICNGIAVHGGLIPFCSTFFVFSDYMKNAIRLSALMNLKVIYIFTHDSIGVGEDGPTHQPIEQLIGLRSIPNLTVYRPADGKETAEAWTSALNGNGPSVLVLSRQNLPILEGTGANAKKGGYIVDDSKRAVPDCILLASGSELSLAVDAKKQLLNDGIDARVVSMLSVDLFENQPEKYKESILPNNVRKRICIEAGSPYSWYKYAGIDGKIIAMNNFGVSAPSDVLFDYYGFTVANIVDTVKKMF